METKFNKLEEIQNKKSPFKVPENYFAQFNEEIMNRLPEKEVVTPQPVPMWSKVRPWVYMAAMFVGLYISINFLTGTMRNKQNAPQTVQTAQTHQTIANTLHDNYWSTIQITEEEFFQYIEDQMMQDGYYDYMYNEIYLN